jgi:hypothetical protein
MADIQFVDGYQCSGGRDSTGGSDPNQFGPSGLSSGGPLETPTDESGYSTDSQINTTGNIPGGGNLESPVD